MRQMASKRTKPKDSADAEEVARQPQAARQAAKSAKAAAREKGSRRAPVAPRKAKKPPGRVVAIGIDVPSLDDLQAEAEAAKGPGGRPESYHPRFAEIARAMCRLGATDFDLACEFGVRTETIWSWRCKYPEFSNSTLEGKEAFDNRIERSLAQRAAGYSYHTEKVFNYEGQIIRAEIVEHVPPDVSAIRLWLMNRRPEVWRDKQEVKLDGSDAFLKVWQAISEGRA